MSSRLTQLNRIIIKTTFAAAVSLTVSTTADAASNTVTQATSAQSAIIQTAPTRRAARSGRRTTTLPSSLKTGIENLSGTDVSKVRVNRSAQSGTRSGAKAFSASSSVRIAPSTPKHLAHESWHAVQQKKGQVRPLSNNANRLNLTKEADAMTRRANNAKSLKTIRAVEQAEDIQKAARRANQTSKSTRFAKQAKTARTVAKANKATTVARHANTARKAHKTAKHARTANTVRKGIKAANTARQASRLAAAGTGVGLAVDVAASMAGVNPADMAVLRATNPAEYNRRMRDLKKNPVKYMGNNIKDNTLKGVNAVGKATAKTGQAIAKGAKAVDKAKKDAAKAVNKATKKAAADVSKATKTAANKVGCGVGNIFAKKKKKC